VGRRLRADFNAVLNCVPEAISLGSRGTMSLTKEDISEAEEAARRLHELLARLIDHCTDYDVERVLKRSEAETMDLRHNLSLVKRLLSDAE